MPTKKTTKKTIKKTNDNSFDLQKMMQNSDSYKSLIYGIVTVVVLFIVIALGVRTLSQNKAEIDNKAAMTSENDNVLTSSYIVSEGETLWSIAEKSYNDGYAWTEIAKANNISDGDALEKGQKLTIPKRDDKERIPSKEVEKMEVSPTVTIEPTEIVSPTTIVTTTPEATKAMEEVVPTNEKITGNTYKIVSGDNLWNIAVRAYGDGYKWVEISKLNNLANPDLIYADDTLKMPRA